MKKAISLLILLVFAATLTGCGFFSKTIKTDNGSINLDKGQVNVTGKDGSQSSLNVASEEGQSVALPDAYPKDLFPIIDGGIIVMANRNEDANKKVTYWVTYTSDKAAKEIYDFYLDAYKDATETQKMELSGTYSVSGVKGGQQFSTTISSEDKDGKKVSTVMITIAPKS